jgi:hypothetical protein
VAVAVLALHHQAQVVRVVVATGLILLLMLVQRTQVAVVVHEFKQVFLLAQVVRVWLFFLILMDTQLQSGQV